MRGLLVGHACEEPQFDHLGFYRMLPGKFIQHIIHSQQFLICVRSRQIQLIHIDPFKATAMTDPELAGRRGR